MAVLVATKISSRLFNGLGLRHGLREGQVSAFLPYRFGGGSFLDGQLGSWFLARSLGSRLDAGRKDGSVDVEGHIYFH